MLLARMPCGLADAQRHQVASSRHDLVSCVARIHASQAPMKIQLSIGHDVVSDIAYPVL
jgi:hypothetical protein